jgi:hypothetical protein
MLELLAELVVEDQLRQILTLELRMLERLVVGLVFADLTQLVEIVLDTNSLLDELQNKNKFSQRLRVQLLRCVLATP